VISRLAEGKNDARPYGRRVETNLEGLAAYCRIIAEMRVGAQSRRRPCWSIE